MVLYCLIRLLFVINEEAAPGVPNNIHTLCVCVCHCKSNKKKVNSCPQLHLHIPIKSFEQIAAIVTFVSPSLVRLCVFLKNSPTGELTEGVQQKSTERRVINSVTVIKTLDSLQGVRLLMSCDMFAAPCT